MQSKATITMSLSVYHKANGKEIHPGTTPFSREKGFRIFPVYQCVCFFRRASRYCIKGLEESLLDGVVNESGYFFFGSYDCLTRSNLNFVMTE